MSHVSSIDVEMQHIAESLGNGQHNGLRCPRCGDHADEHALAVLVDGAAIKAICYRASCGFRYNNGGYTKGLASRPSRARPYTGELRSLDEADYLWFMERFHLPRKAIGEVRKSDGRYFLPILSPEGTRRGWVSRRPWDDSPLCETGLVKQRWDGEPKSLTYMENEEPVQHWTGWALYKPTVLVEDQISALKLAWYVDLTAVAILGTGLNEEKVAELQRNTKSILIALDADATGQAFSMARKWGQAFQSCRVIILDKDVKDEPISTVKKIFSPFSST